MKIELFLFSDFSKKNSLLIYWCIEVYSINWQIRKTWMSPPQSLHLHRCRPTGQQHLPASCRKKTWTHSCSWTFWLPWRILLHHSPQSPLYFSKLEITRIRMHDVHLNNILLVATFSQHSQAAVPSSWYCSPVLHSIVQTNIVLFLIICTHDVMFWLPSALSFASSYWTIQKLSNFSMTSSGIRSVGMLHSSFICKCYI